MLHALYMIDKEFNEHELCKIIRTFTIHLIAILLLYRASSYHQTQLFVYSQCTVTTYLECTDFLPELLPLEKVRQGAVEGALSEADHLRSNANTALVQDFNRNLVALADFAKDISDRNLNNVEVRQLCGTKNNMLD